MIMSQASLTSFVLKSLSKSNIMCKFAFFISPPTTFYNIVHQIAIWFLVYAISQHGNKLRKKRIIVDVDYGEMMKSDDSDYYDDEKAIVVLNDDQDLLPQKANVMFSYKRKNFVFFFVLLFFVSAYNSQNFFFYSLTKLEGKDQTFYVLELPNAFDAE